MEEGRKGGRGGSHVESTHYNSRSFSGSKAKKQKVLLAKECQEGREGASAPANKTSALHSWLKEERPG